MIYSILGHTMITKDVNRYKVFLIEILLTTQT